MSSSEDEVILDQGGPKQDVSDVLIREETQTCAQGTDHTPIEMGLWATASPEPRGTQDCQ